MLRGKQRTKSLALLQLGKCALEISAVHKCVRRCFLTFFFKIITGTRSNWNRTSYKNSYFVTSY